MQVTVTSKSLRNKRKTKVKSAIKVIFIFLIAVILSAFFVSLKKKSLMYLEREFYFVSVASSKKSGDLDTHSELLKNLGGANAIYCKNGVYYLIASVYLDLSSAEEIKRNLLVYFHETEVITVKVKAISKKNRKILNNNRQVFKFLYDLSFKFQDLQMGYLSGGVSEGKLISSMVKYRLEIERYKTTIVGDDELSDTLAGFCDLFSLQIASFLTGLSTVKSKQNYVCNFFAGFYMNYIEMYDCL